MNTAKKAHRDTLFLEDAEILSHTAYPGNQFILQVRAPHCAAHAQPGSFVHLRCDETLPLRRPLSIMRANTGTGTVDFYYKVGGTGMALLSNREVGETLSILGPIGKPFVLHPEKPRTILIGGGVGIPPMVFLADKLRKSKEIYQPLVIMGSEIPFPFTARPSRIMLPGIPAHVIAAMPLMEDWGIASRLTSLQGYPGCFEGYVTDLARSYLQALTDKQREETELFSCGPEPMLRAVAKLASEFQLSCQISLEEFMPCAVGGCAGCAVKINTPQGPAMKRVCVDGPVFDASTVDGYG